MSVAFIASDILVSPHHDKTDSLIEGTCKDMVKYVVTDACIGCTRCAKVCPVEAIEYKPYEIHAIDTDKCTMCGLCITECEFDAIKKMPLKTL